MKLLIVLVAILVALSLSGVIGAEKRSMSKGTYDPIIKMIKGEFDVPVGQRTLEQRNAIVRFLRNQESYQLNEDGVLLCDGKLVINHGCIQPLCLVAAHLLQNKRDCRKSSVIVVPRNWLPKSASA